MKTLGNKIKEARLQKGLTQKQLASQLSIKNTTLNNWEQDRNKPDINYVEMLCNLLDVTPDYFLEIQNSKKNFSTEEYELLIKYQSLSAEGKSLVKTVVNNIKMYERSIRESISSILDNQLHSLPTSYIITPTSAQDTRNANAYMIHDFDLDTFEKQKIVAMPLNDNLEILDFNEHYLMKKTDTDDLPPEKAAKPK